MKPTWLKSCSLCSIGCFLRFKWGHCMLICLVFPPFRDYVRSSLHLSSMTKRFWFSSTERNTEFGEHILLLCIQRLRQPGLESTPYFFAYNWVSSLQYLLHRLLFIPEWAQIRRLECKVVYEQSIRLVEFFQGAMTCTWCWAPPAAKSRFRIILLFSVLSALLVTVFVWYYMKFCSKILCMFG